MKFKFGDVVWPSYPEEDEVRLMIVAQHEDYDDVVVLVPGPKNNWAYPVGSLRKLNPFRAELVEE